MDQEGLSQPNISPEELERYSSMYEEANLKNPAFIIDCNHSNSGKQYLKQMDIARDIARLRKENASVGRVVKGLMIESYLEDGNQCDNGGVFGKSITDPCLGWEKSEKLVLELAEIW